MAPAGALGAATARAARARPAAAAVREAAAACAAAGQPSAASGARTRSAFWRGLPRRGWLPPQWERTAYVVEGRRRGTDPTAVGGTPPATEAVEAALYAHPGTTKESVSRQNEYTRWNSQSVGEY